MNGADGLEKPPHAKGAIARARHLRQIMSLGEQKLWRELRKLKLNIRRQAPLGRYVVDFVHHGAAVVVEVDGYHHTRPEVALRDEHRDAWLIGQGYYVLRLQYADVHADPWAAAQSALRIIRRRSRLPGDYP